MKGFLLVLLYDIYRFHLPDNLDFCFFIIFLFSFPGLC